MVSKFGVCSRLVLACVMILFGSLIVGSTAMAQSGNAAEAPFIGFRPFGSEQAVPAGASGTASGLVNVQSRSTQGPRIIPEQPASAYPYPASGSPNYGAVSNSRTGTAERASLGGRLPSTTTPTGSLNNATNSTIGQTTGFDRTTSGSQATGTAPPAEGVDPALWQRYQQELQQQQAQQQYQQYQQWLAQQQQYQLQRQTSSVGFRSQQTSTTGQTNPVNNRVAQPTLATRANPAGTSSARTTTAKMNQPVVQQVSSTTTSNRDNSVAHADWSSWVTAKSPSTTSDASTTNSTSVAKQAASVAKPQCCCVPQNCCVPRNCCAPTTPAPTTPAPVFRPQTVTPLARPVANQVPSLGLPNLAANQVPTLGPSANSTFGGFLGQAGANYQVQPLGTNQFQAGLGVPQFRSTGALGTGLGIGSGGGLGSWFSNGLFGTGAYTPLLPLVNAQGARLGQGIIGQPTAYMDGQPLRNLLRYLSP